jgi:hypothetical protein
MADVESKLIQMLKNQKRILANQRMLLEAAAMSIDPNYSPRNTALRVRFEIIDGMTERCIDETDELLKP